MIGLPLGLLYANAVEWVVHKYVLHGLGKRKHSFFAFHWRNHHKNARRFGNYDPDYEKPWYDWRSRGKEAGGILALMAVHLPLAPVAPWFTAAVCYASFNYLYKHERCHTDVEWGKKHMRSHYDHHMGKDQDMNWCVTQPWFDYVMGTREYFFEHDVEARRTHEAPGDSTSRARARDETDAEGRQARRDRDEQAEPRLVSGVENLVPEAPDSRGIQPVDLPHLALDAPEAANASEGVPSVPAA